MVSHLKVAVLENLPTVNMATLDALLEREIAATDMKIVVLDDDPTGIQTVHDVSVYTDWSLQSIIAGFMEKERLFYVLTNSRSLTAEKSEQIHREIARTLAYVGKWTGRPYLLISRGDSTLRGHYPLETAVLREELESTESAIDGEILCPFFKEGGRYTFENVHYVRMGDELIPVGETEFARDKTFGYMSSNLCVYVEEKTHGEYRAEDVTSIRLEDLRVLALDKIEEQLMNVHGFGKVVVNAASDNDVKAFCVALYRAIARGKRFLFRTAASFVKVIAGVADRPLLTRKELIGLNSGRGGLVVVGSHTQKTTDQLYRLLELPTVRGMEFNSDLVLDGEKAIEEEAFRAAARCDEWIAEGVTPVCYTKRKLLALESDTREDALLRSVKISWGVQRLVSSLQTVPAFIIAKGGITSSDVGTKVLGVRCARVLGQICPGVPVWRTGPESRFPGLPYIIFPGNLGEEFTLKEAVMILQGYNDALCKCVH